jgi:hypothetical protein
LAKRSEEFVKQVDAKVEAFERFVIVHGIVLGMLQALSLESADAIWILFPRWFQHGYPSKQIVRLTLQHCGARILCRSTPVLFLHQFLAQKKRTFRSQFRQSLVN